MTVAPDADTRDEALARARALTTIEAAALVQGASEWDSRALPGRGIPSFVMSDGPHGVRRQLGSGDHLGIGASEKATCFPTAATVANSWDPSLAEEMGAALGEEATALGVDVLLGPGLNITRNPLCGRAFEYYSEDPVQAGRMAAGLVRGIQSTGVSACPKHFAVNSQEMRRMASDSVVDERTMREVYLTAFEIVTREAHPRALMTSYNKVNGTYANENRHLLTEILREEWGFDGMVVSDWGGSNSAVEAVRAGSSLEMPAPGYDSTRLVAAAVDEGRLSRADLDARAAEVIRMALDAPSNRSAEAGAAGFDVDAHHALARRVAEGALVLLRNEGDVLPLTNGTRVALVGDMAVEPRYQGAGSSQVNPTRLSSLADVLTAHPALDLVGVARGYDRRGADRPDLVTEAASLAERAEVVVAVIGLDEMAESEGMDRPHMRIADAQIRLLEALRATGTPVVALLVGGAPVEVPWLPLTDALVHTCLAGQAGAEAIARVLTGEVNPSGRLAQTWPLRWEDLPSSREFPAPGALALYREGPYVGYRHSTTVGADVAFPFGFGLGYSRVSHDSVRLVDGGVEVTLTHRSGPACREVVQMYVERPGRVWGPTRELKAFAKIDLSVGETRTVVLPFDRYTFRHFDVASGTWAEEAGTWTVRVGSSSTDLPLHVEVDRAGSGPEPTRDEALGRYLTGDVLAVTDAEFAHLLGREVPQDEARRELDLNDPLLRLDSAPSALARFAGRQLASRRRAADAKGQPDLNILFLQNMPVRAIGKMSKGAVSMDMAEGILDLVNGHGVRGIGRLISGAWRNMRDNRATARAIEEAPRAR